jgi:hypothetical protein
MAKESTRNVDIFQLRRTQPSEYESATQAQDSRSKLVLYTHSSQLCRATPI